MNQPPGVPPQTYGQPPPGYGPPPGQYGYPPPQPPQKKGMSVWLILLIVFGSMFLLGIGSCVVCVGMAGHAASQAQTTPRPTSTAASTSTSTATATAAPTATTVEAIKVSAKKLFADYHANEVSADEQYKGQYLLVNGTIASIDKDAFGNMVVRLNGGDSFGLETVNATLDDSQKTKAMTLKKSQQVTVFCKGGTMIIGSPTLDDCKLPNN